MSQPQDQVTHRLVTFIQSIQLRRGSGLLSAKRGEGNSVEEGSITFVNGQVTDAKVGRYTGSEAFNRLSTWENCHFSFVLHRSSQEAHPDLTHTDELASISSTVERFPDTQSLSLDPVERFPDTQSLSPVPERNRSSNPETPPMFSQLTFKQGYLYLGGTGVPRPGRRLSAALQMIDLMGLSRAHRRLFLLIDGKRSIDELAPLIGRTPEEVSELLRDLERASVILMPNGSS
jgi:hypothetical protein